MPRVPAPARSGDFSDSIAVFPFENAGGAPELEYLSDGITETIINSLSRLRRLRVVPRTTMFRNRGRTDDPIQTGRELRARAVLIGRVSERAGDLIVDVELVDTAHESQLWGEKYNRSLSDILTVQGEIASEVSNTLRLQLSGQEGEYPAPHPTRNLEAYHLLIKGSYYANKWTPDPCTRKLGHPPRAGVFGSATFP